MTVDQQFTALYEKLQLLLRQYNRLQRDAEKLKEELAQSKQHEAATQSRLEEVQQQVAILRLAAGEMSEKEKKAFERKLNQYIREIDKAIGYLSE